MTSTVKDHRFVSLALICLLMFGVGPGLDMVLPCEAITNDAHIPCKGLVELKLTPLPPSSRTVPPNLLSPTTRNYTTHLITTRSSSGPFFMTYGRGIPATEAREIRNEAVSCSCRSACMFASWCVAFSTVKTNAEVLCHLADHFPIETEADDRAAYHVFYERMTEAFQMFTIQGTNDIYVVTKTELSYPDGEAFCNSLPGFRPAVFITETDIEILFRLYAELSVPLYVGLTKTITGFNWVDGTSYFNSYYFFYNPEGLSGFDFGENCFRFDLYLSKLMFLDAAGHRTFRFLCQAYLY